MIEIATFGLMVLALIVHALTRDYRRARRDRHRGVEMNGLAAQFTNQAAADLVRMLGEPYEVVHGLSNRAMYVWKAPPNKKLPQGSGLLTVSVTVEADGIISEIAWRDRID
jgi:hypothetical protein